MRIKSQNSLRWPPSQWTVGWMSKTNLDSGRGRIFFLDISFYRTHCDGHQASGQWAGCRKPISTPVEAESFFLTSLFIELIEGGPATVRDEKPCYSPKPNGSAGGIAHLRGRDGSNRSCLWQPATFCT